MVKNPSANECQAQKRKAEQPILHLPWLKTVKGRDSSQALNPNPLKDFSEEISLIPNCRVVRGKLQKQIKGLESRTTEQDLQGSKHLVHQRGVRGAL